MMEGTISVFCCDSYESWVLCKAVSKESPKGHLMHRHNLSQLQMWCIKNHTNNVNKRKKWRWFFCKSGCCHELEPPSLSLLSKNKADSQLAKSFSSQRSGNEDGSKAYFSLTVIMRDPLDQLCLGMTSLRVQHLFHPSQKGQPNCAGSGLLQEPEKAIVVSTPFS